MKKETQTLVWFMFKKKKETALIPQLTSAIFPTNKLSVVKWWKVHF